MLRPLFRALSYPIDANKYMTKSLMFLNSSGVFIPLKGVESILPRDQLNKGEASSTRWVPLALLHKPLINKNETG